MTRKLNELNCITDMGKFPWSVHLGASTNIIFTIWLTSLIFNKTNGEMIILPLFAVTIITLNLIPVLILRKKEQNKMPYPEVDKMNFFGDQHRFSTWVYVVASSNMFFWITLSWCIFSYNSSIATVLFVQSLSLFITYVPLWREAISRYKAISAKKSIKSNTTLPQA